ncbi:FadR family transcriptional regulator [Novacetimonas cocois]|uniref:FadR family transcriptional regulator n=2 Tax=Novacetimonas cocois TaxID=1747507 RepID=A0A365YTV3_9PROT|nr:FadR family transcriptional regulator [Novacetimonas cocois]
MKQPMSSFPPLPRHSLVEQAIAVMRERVAKGEWALGERIPKETELAQLLQVGRNTVREAVRVLSHAGMLEVRQGDGTYVRSRTDPADVMHRISRSGLRDHFELRVVLEAEAARLAALRRTERDLKRLEKLLEARGEKVSGSVDMEAFVARDTAFHLAIAEASHNRALSELYRYFVSEVRRGTHTAVMEPALPEPGLAAHVRILDAIRNQDPAGAERAAREAVTPLLTAMSQA